MIKPLYHGTIYKIDTIDLSVGKGFKDFGKGFYTTGDKQQAIKWAELMYKRTKSNSDNLPTSIRPIVYKFDVDTDALYHLNVKKFREADREWLLFVAQNRRNKGSFHNYDCVIGKIADDNTRLVIDNFMNGVYGDVNSNFAIETAIRLLRTDNLKEQWFFNTQASVDLLVKVGEI